MEPITRKEKILSAIVDGTSLTFEPVTREEKYLAAIKDAFETGGGSERGPKGDKGDKGDPGEDGKAATINGVNALTVVQGENVTLSQSGSVLTISATDTTYEVATENTAGLMSATDKGTLNKAVPTSRTINGKPLSADVTLAASDIGAADALEVALNSIAPPPAIRPASTTARTVCP